MALVDLKARAFDILVAREKLDLELQQVNRAIQQEMAKPKEETPKE